jgi:ectoine hydroxylase-related dioxygenase (phytanoyl-CoA dioxygenase family)
MTTQLLGGSCSAIDLGSTYPLTPQQVARFRDQGFIKLKNVLSPQTIEYYGARITEQVHRLNDLHKPMAQRTTYEKAFLQVMNIWTKSPVVKQFAFSRRLARIAAELMGVRGVRMYHDQALYKEAGGGLTPWHADQYYWPVDTPNTCTVWVPLQATALEMGALAFSAGSHRFASGRDLEISDDSEKRISKALLETGLPLIEEPFDLGEVSYHYGWTFHRAGPNTSGRPRAVMTVIYIEDGCRLTRPANKNQQNDWNTWMPGAAIGQPVDTPLNPLLYREDPAG